MAIRQYESPISSVRPSEVGVEATAGAARRAGGFFSQSAAALRALGSETAAAGEQTARMVGSSIRDAGAAAVDYADHQQIATGAANGAKLFNDLDKGMNEAVKSIDPNDSNYGQKVEAAVAKWREQNLEPSLEKFKEGFSTENSQKWGDHFVERTREHMFISSSAEVSTAAGIGIKNAIHTTVNEASATVNRDPTPGTINTQFDLLDHSVTGMVATSPVKGTAGAAIRSEVLTAGKEAIVKSAAMGYIQKTGEMPKWASDPAYAPYINGAELKTFQQYANAQQRANILTQKQIETYQRQQQAEAAHATLSKTWTDSVSFDDSGKATIKPDYYKRVMDTEMKFPGAATERARAMINWGQAQQKEKRETIITDPATQSALYTGLFNTEKPTTDVDILKAANENKLDAHATSTLLSLHKSLEEAPLKGPIYQGTMAAVKGVLGDSEKGHENYAKFLQTFIPEYLKKQRDGTLPPNALDIRDDKSLISQSLAPWRLTPQEKMMGQMFKRLGLGGDMGQGFDPVKLLNPSATTPDKPTRKIGDVPVPPMLNGIAALQYNKAKGQWRDQTSGKIYDSAGKEIAQ